MDGDGPAASAPMSALVVAFSAAATDALTGVGWRKHTGDVFTREAGRGTSAWLGLNRAARHRPLRIDPVAGVRHDATMRVCDHLGGGTRYVAATLSEPIADPGHELLVDTTADIDAAVAQLLRLVGTKAMPFVAAYREPEHQLAALRRREHLVVPESAIIRVPAMLAVLGREEEALDALSAEIATLGDRDDDAARHYRRLADALRGWIGRSSSGVVPP